MKHTPGPWIVNKEKYGSEIVETDYDPKVERVSGCACSNRFIADLNDGEYHEYLNQ